MRNQCTVDRRRSGLTKVDWLVLLCGVGILMGLLIPAVDRNPPHRRNRCATQVSNFSKAAIQYEMARGRLPGYLNDFGSNVGVSDPFQESDASLRYRAGDKKQGSWMVLLLPYLDAQPTYEIWTQQKYPLLVSKDGVTRFTPHAAPNLAILQCPASNPFESEWGRNSYIANTGMHHLTASGQPLTITRAKNEGEETTSFHVTFSDSMQSSNGAMNNQYELATNVADYPTGPKVTFDDFKDGLGNTALFSESLQAIPWHQLDPDTNESVRLLQPLVPGEQVAYPKFARFTQGMIWLYEDPEGANGAPHVPVHRRNVINSSVDGRDKNLLKMDHKNAVELARPSSGHHEGCNFGFADGSTRFITETIDYRVYQALLTPHGKQSLVPEPSFVPK